MNQSKKILITGGTGYIGNYLTKILAGTRPEISIISMSRRPIDQQQQRDEQTARFKNVRFWQGDSLKPETFPPDLKECDAVIHTVGTLIEGMDYKGPLEGRIPQSLQDLNPLKVLKAASDTLSGGVKYDESHEAMNRDSCKLMAEHYNNSRKGVNKTGHFVFISASKSIAPMLSKYIEMKEQAESFLLNNCPVIIPVILKPGFVWHPSERSWSVPLKYASDITYELNKNLIQYLPGNQLIQGALPQSHSIHLSLLTDFIIRGALGELDDLNASHVWTNEMMLQQGNQKKQ